jgi:hypothetical protein
MLAWLPAELEVRAPYWLKALSAGSPNIYELLTSQTGLKLL